MSVSAHDGYMFIDVDGNPVEVHTGYYEARPDEVIERVRDARRKRPGPTLNEIRKAAAPS